MPLAMPLATPVRLGGPTLRASQGASQRSSHGSSQGSSAVRAAASPAVGAGAPPGEMSVPGRRLCLQSMRLPRVLGAVRELPLLLNRVPLLSSPI